MPMEGRTRFKELKKEYEKGTEVRGETLGIIRIRPDGSMDRPLRARGRYEGDGVDNHATTESIGTGGRWSTDPCGCAAPGPAEELLAHSDAVSSA